MHAFLPLPPLCSSPHRRPSLRISHTSPRADLTPPPPPARPCGWVRRAAINAGRTLAATTGSQKIEWSVPENEEEPSCELERLAWAADALVENLRETKPFSLLQVQVRALPPARGAALTAALRSGGAVSARGPALLFANMDVFRDLRSRPENADAAFLARDMLVVPYQVFRARADGADGFVLQAAVWPVADIGYQARVGGVLGMACVVECGSPEQVRELLRARPKVDALLLCARDVDQLGGDAASFEALYGEFEDELKEWGVPVVAEAAAGVTTEVAVAEAPRADAVLVDVPPMR